jgi:hypothetical protein
MNKQLQNETQKSPAATPAQACVAKLICLAEWMYDPGLPDCVQHQCGAGGIYIEHKSTSHACMLLSAQCLPSMCPTVSTVQSPPAAALAVGAAGCCTGVQAALCEGTYCRAVMGYASTAPVWHILQCCRALRLKLCRAGAISCWRSQPQP